MPAYISSTMSRLAPAPLLVLSVCSAAALVAAEFSPVLEKPASPAPSGARAVSPTVAGLLAVASPKYEAPAEAVKETPPPEPEKPRNGIIRLPPYKVQEGRLPNFKERDLLTPSGRLDLAYQRHPGLNFGSWGPFNNNAWARAMLGEEFALERMKEMYDLLSLLPANQRPPLILLGRPGHEFQGAYSGPEAGLLVPWERR